MGRIGRTEADRAVLAYDEGRTGGARPAAVRPPRTRPQKRSGMAAKGGRFPTVWKAIDVRA